MATHLMCALGVKIAWISYGRILSKRFLVDKGNVDLSPVLFPRIRSVFVSSSLLPSRVLDLLLYGGMRPFAY